MRPDRMDIHAVARRAHVSIATVSRTINHVPTVSPQLATRVWEAIRELNYLPNTQARALVSGRSRILGLIVSEITNPFFPELIQGFEDCAVENGYEILIGSTNYEPERMQRCIRRMMERKADGVAVMTFGIEQPLLDQLADRNVPLVFVDVAPERPGISILKVDYHRGIRQGVQHLAALGHRRIAFVTGPPRLHSAQSRLAAFRNSLGECGIRVEDKLIIEGDHTMEGGMAAAEKIKAREILPTAIMCSNDMLAIGVLHELAHSGVRVPDEVSIIGFDDIHMASMMIPPLTSIQMSRAALASGAVSALRGHLEGAPKREYRIDTQLVVRESTGFPRGTMAHFRREERKARLLRGKVEPDSVK
ncbi:MAG TPA: LacI family DNA-binding transcriptional regulator [Acidobacteriaceae bacterium]|nr:LacI family DNA-binding transcriptional regulator [Acidobacteriaceae bacterium]